MKEKVWGMFMYAWRVATIGQDNLTSAGLCRRFSGGDLLQAREMMGHAQYSNEPLKLVTFERKGRSAACEWPQRGRDHCVLKQGLHVEWLNAFSAAAFSGEGGR